MMRPIFDRATAERLADHHIDEHDGHIDAGVFEYRHKSGATAFGVTLSGHKPDGEIWMQSIFTQDVP